MHSGAVEKIIKYRFVFKSLGVVVGIISNLVSMWSNCRGSIGVYISLFAVLTSVALAIALFFASGGAMIAVIGFLLPLLQSQLVEFLRDKFC